MIIINSIVKAFEAYQQYAERAAALKELRQLSVHQLADIGIEPYQLARGISAYPWREQKGEETGVAAPVFVEAANAAKPKNTFAGTLVTLYNAWGQPARQW